MVWIRRDFSQLSLQDMLKLLIDRLQCEELKSSMDVAKHITKPDCMKFFELKKISAEKALKCNDTECSYVLTKVYKYCKK